MSEDYNGCKWPDELAWRLKGLVCQHVLVVSLLAGKLTHSDSCCLVCSRRRSVVVVLSVAGDIQW